MNKEQAEELAKLMKEAGIEVHVMQGEIPADAPSDGPLGAIAKQFMEAISKKANENKAGETSQSDRPAQEDKDTDNKPAYANHTFEALKETASRVNLFVEHPMLTNLSTHEAVATLALTDVMLDDLVEHNPNFIAAATEDTSTRMYLNSIFYAVDIMMKAKADAGLLTKPDAAVKVKSAE